MKQTYLTLLAALSFGAPGLLLADTVQVEQGPYQYSDAGELVTLTSPNNFLSDYAPVAVYNGGFATFAADNNVIVTYNTPYTYTLGQSDYQGHALTQGAALLYYDFAEGTLPGYDYSDLNTSPDGGYYRIQDAGELQAAIWSLMGISNPLGSSYPAGGMGNTFYDYALSVDPNALAANNGEYDVDIMQLSGPSGAAQNVLVVPSSVPDAASTWALLGGSVCVLGMSRKKLQRG